MSRRLTTLLLLAVAALPGPDSWNVQAQDDSARGVRCDETSILRASTHYDFGLFEESARQLRPCLPDGYGQKEQRVSAYRLLALNHIVTDSLDMARESVRALLKTDSGYKADPAVDPPQFADLIEAERPAWYTFLWEGGGGARWLGRAAVVGTAVAVPLMLRDNSPEPLPGPPALPDGGGN